MKTKVEIIEEVAAFYNNSNRAIDDIAHECVYETSDGRCCAVGKYMIPSIRERYIDRDSISVSDLCEHEETTDINQLLVEDARGHGMEFWTSLQNFHDREIFWTLNGLSEKGEEHKKELIKQYKDQ